MSPDQAGNPLIQMFPFIAIFGIFYFLVIRPERTKQNELKKMIAAIKKNDEVITVGGAHGTVSLVKDKTVVVRVDENVKIEFDKEAIKTVVKSKE